MRRTTIAFALAVAALWVACAGSFADGFIVLRRPPEMPRPLTPLAVKFHHVDVEINDQVAVTKIDQVFLNPNQMQLEGEYIFPLPAGSTVTDFSMFMGGQEVHGEILDSQKAREIYEGIVRRQQDPALLEYVGLRMFRARVFPIPANGETRIKLEYMEQLERNQGQSTYRYPLNTEKFSSKPLDSVAINLQLRTKDRIKVVDCPSHQAEIVEKGANYTKIAYEKKNVTPDKDFVVNFSVASGDFGINIATYKNRSDAFFRLVVSPDAELKDELLQKKVVIFVMDTSLSMIDEDKITQARKALKYCVHSMRAGDSFNIVDFSTEARQFDEKLVDVGDANVKWADEYIDKIQARGGTAIDEALQLALKMQNPSDERPFMIVFVTDGRPTWGERDPSRILENVKKGRKADVRIFAFGVGNDVDTLFLDRLAAQNGGAREYITPGEDLEVKVSAFFDKVSFPVLTDVSLSVVGLKVSDVFPRPLGDIFKGSQLIVHGRYEGEGARAVELRGKIAGKERRFIYEVNFDGKSNGGEFIPRLWAQASIAYMLEEIRLRGENAELKNEIIRLSKKYGIMDNKYVSWLVVEDEGRRVEELRRRDGPRAAGSPSPTPTPSPSGGAFSDSAAKEKKDLGSAREEMESDKEKGAEAVQGIKAMRTGGKAGDAGDGANSIKKIVSDKTFYRQGEYWIDSDFDVDKDKAVDVTFMSDEYFSLLAKHKGINVYLALATKVLVKIDGVSYRIIESGK